MRISNKWGAIDHTASASGNVNVMRAALGAAKSVRDIGVASTRPISWSLSRVWGSAFWRRESYSYRGMVEGAMKVMILGLRLPQNTRMSWMEINDAFGLMHGRQRQLPQARFTDQFRRGSLSPNSHRVNRGFD